MAMVDMEPKIAAAYDILRACKLCPRNCGVDRFTGHVGFCGMGRAVVVSSAAPHFGEEGVLVGSGGSGTIFLAGCNLGCVFCQNYDISHLRQGTDVSIHEVVSMMLRLQQIGCHNINFVTPTHFTPQLMEAIHRARQQGLTVPIVWNCGGYEALDTLRLLEGFVQVYMPDAKYADAAVADELSAAPDYPDVMKAAIREMQRQVGDLQIADGLATRGLLVRHLVLPNNAAGSRAIIDFLADEISPDTYVNVMGQYHPEYHAGRDPVIGRRPTFEEIAAARDYARKRGLRPAE
jgi:putative pyruvate formate lyase activating enzyme